MVTYWGTSIPTLLTSQILNKHIIFYVSKENHRVAQVFLCVLMFSKENYSFAQFFCFFLRDQDTPQSTKGYPYPGPGQYIMFAQYIMFCDGPPGWYFDKLGFSQSWLLVQQYYSNTIYQFYNSFIICVANYIYNNIIFPILPIFANVFWHCWSILYNKWLF